MKQILILVALAAATMVTGCKSIEVERHAQQVATYTDTNGVVKAVCDNAGKPVILDGKREKVTISAGLAMFDNSEPDLSDLLSRAERKLNKSKREGKNKVSF